jgi:hypothetical protein
LEAQTEFSSSDLVASFTWTDHLVQLAVGPTSQRNVLLFLPGQLSTMRLIFSEIHFSSHAYMLSLLKNIFPKCNKILMIFFSYISTFYVCTVKFHEKPILLVRYVKKTKKI